MSTSNIFDQVAQEEAAKVASSNQPQTEQPSAQSPAQPSTGNIFDQVAQEEAQKTQQNAVQTVKPKLQPYDAKAFGRYTTPENYEKWASTQPKIGPDSKPGEYEAWTGAHMSNAETLATIPKAAAETLAGVTLAGPAASLIEAAPAVAAYGWEHAPEIARAVLNHVKEPGTIIKLPFGRAAEYYMLSKLGLSKGAIAQIASHIP